MKSIHKNFSLTRCGLFINKEHPFLHATLDFLTQCDCCGLGCGEVKNSLTLENGDFEKYATHKHSCLEKKDDKFALKRTHNYYYQVQQQLFTLPERKQNDFVVCGVDADGNAHLFTECILPDTQHWDRVVPKLELFLVKHGTVHIVADFHSLSAKGANHMHSIKINRMLSTRKHHYVTKSVFVKQKLLQMTDFWSATVKDAVFPPWLSSTEKNA